MKEMLSLREFVTLKFYSAQGYKTFKKKKGIITLINEKNNVSITLNETFSNINDGSYLVKYMLGEDWNSFLSTY